MYVYFLRVRARSEEAAHAICRDADHLLPLFQEPGWLGGACLHNTTDPRDLIIYGRWANEASARAWLDSAAGRLSQQRLSSNATAAPEIGIFQGEAV
ncbi:MAG TPA: antibiotic biosynthesis monooxygenase [Chloroflexota bacterium]|nr:antibiotic biosynthesis monooxygenase [Chloroflexota bacterium]